MLSVVERSFHRQILNGSHKPKVAPNFHEEGVAVATTRHHQPYCMLLSTTSAKDCRELFLLHNETFVSRIDTFDISTSCVMLGF